MQDNSYGPPPPNYPGAPGQPANFPGGGSKPRHGCVTGWLVFMIIANSITGLIYAAAPDLITQNLPNRLPDWSLPVLTIMTLANVVLAVALLRWKKWGFYGFVGTTILGFFVNVASGLGGQSFTGLLGVVILYVVLQVESNGHKAWNLME